MRRWLYVYIQQFVAAHGPSNTNMIDSVVLRWLGRFISDAQNAGFSEPQVGTVLAGGINLVATAVGVALVDRAGRRALLLIALAGSAVCTFFISMTLILKVRF